ncbi:MAG TPA: hypothetical protein VJ951_11655 [Bacteroidales bacterium]|nr:hypothetical protein [Bacteroidales bacterium]
MASKKHLKEEALAMIDSLNENIHEIELSIKSGADEVDQEITTHLTALKKVRLQLRLVLDKYNLSQVNDDAEKANEIWEIISDGRKVLSEKKRIFDNRTNK